MKVTIIAPNWWPKLSKDQWSVRPVNKVSKAMLESVKVAASAVLPTTKPVARKAIDEAMAPSVA